MRIVVVLLLVGVIGLTCGPKTTESQAQNDKGITLSGQIVYSDSLSTGAPNVWVVYGTVETDSTDSLRLDSVFTDTTGLFTITGAVKGDLFYELYREPRTTCWGRAGTFTATIHQTGLKWVYVQRPECENVWMDTTGGYK